MFILAAATTVLRCDTPHTDVVVDNLYAPTPSGARVVYRAFWQSVAFDTPVLPGASSEPHPAIPASANTAYVLLAPGWDPSSNSPPSAFIVLESRSGFALHLNGVLHIPVGNEAFAGDCSSGSTLSQMEADFVTQRVFASVFAGLHYDAATCTTSPATNATDGGAGE